jgi:hypothetical protein
VPGKPVIALVRPVLPVSGKCGSLTFGAPMVSVPGQFAGNDC